MPSSISKPGRERVQALAAISRSALCCHSNETRAPIANPTNRVQLEGTTYHSLNLHPGPCSSVGMQRGTDRQTDRQTDGRGQYLTQNVTKQPLSPHISMQAPAMETQLDANSFGPPMPSSIIRQILC